MNHQTILIVDDTPDHLDLLCRVLESAGYRVVTAHPGEEADRQARRERPDLILAALSLPGQPAWETAQRLSATLGHTPILGTTVYSTLLSAPRARAIGCVDYLEKPFSFDELLHRVEGLLAGAPAA
ncbi:MAG TPA: response regulator [Roseiflexaceae bacterium]|nr:response regulator [Roseiflexaceae bacterium]